MLQFPYIYKPNFSEVKSDSTQHGEEDHKHTFCLPQLQTATSDTSVAQINMSKKCYSHEPESSRAKLILPGIPIFHPLQCFTDQIEINQQHISFSPL